MDAKTYPNLNPKLKETYDRIMGTATAAKPHAPTPAAAKSSTPLPHDQHDSTPAAPEHHVTPGHLSHLAYNASMAHKKEKPESAPATTAGVKKDSLLLPLILAAGGVVFFVAYAIFWMSFFGLK